MADYHPELYGQVEALYRTQQPPYDMVEAALAYRCPDCNVNVVIKEDEEIDGKFTVMVAHDETCPWLKQHEAGSSRNDPAS